jgi:hypothetical protein
MPRVLPISKFYALSSQVSPCSTANRDQPGGGSVDLGHSKELGFTDRIKAMIFQRSSLVLMI